MIRKTVSARTRLVKSAQIGERVFFYRKYPPAGKNKTLQAQRGCWLGPAVVIGMQGKNYWLAFAARCYVVAPEHLRGLAPDELWLGRNKLTQEGLAQLQAASTATDYLDLSQQDVTAEELATAVEQVPLDETQALALEKQAED